MDGIALHRLGKRLTELAADVVRASDPASYTPGEQAVLAALHRAPGSSVNDVAAATGFAQSHVSATVGRLRQAGVVTAEPDPADARRLRLALSPAARRGLRRRLGGPIGPALRRDLGAADAQRAERLLSELEELLSDR